MKITEWLRLPETKAIRDLNSPETTLLHADIIQRKPFLKRVYIDFYNQFKKSLSGDLRAKLIVELGSGGGFIKEIIPSAITSDVLRLPNVDRNFSALDMPFQENTVDAYFMFDVLHHIEDCRAFFKEVDRTLKIGGKVIVIDVANTLWSRFIHKNFHHETFDPGAGWTFEKTGPLSSGNGAIPWIIFLRDRTEFEREFPSLKIRKLKPHTPFRYLASGGVSMRQLAPSFTYNIVKGAEILLSPLNRYLGLFMTIEIEKAP